MFSVQGQREMTLRNSISFHSDNFCAAKRVLELSNTIWSYQQFIAGVVCQTKCGVVVDSLLYESEKICKQFDFHSPRRNQSSQISRNSCEHKSEAMVEHLRRSFRYRHADELLRRSLSLSLSIPISSFLLAQFYETRKCHGFRSALCNCDATRIKSLDHEKPWQAFFKTAAVASL